MYKDEMTPMQIGVIDNFCNNLNDQKTFVRLILSKTFGRVPLLENTF